MKWLVVIVGVGISVLFGSHLKEASENVWRVSGVLQAWEDEGLHTTAMWRVREHLSRQWWLGPLRPNPPQDPVKDYVGRAGTTGWILMLRPRETRQLLSRLEDHIRRAKEEHEAFRKNIMWFIVFYVCLSLGLFVARFLVLCFLFPNAMSSTPSLFKETEWDEMYISDTDFPPRSTSRPWSSHFPRAKLFPKIIYCVSPVTYAIKTAMLVVLSVSRGATHHSLPPHPSTDYHTSSSNHFTVSTHQHLSLSSSSITTHHHPSPHHHPITTPSPSITNRSAKGRVHKLTSIRGQIKVFVM